VKILFINYKITGDVLSRINFTRCLKGIKWSIGLNSKFSTIEIGLGFTEASICIEWWAENE